ncbi:MAG: TonB-dependent receptor [Agriterribacter sp.]
MRVFIIFLFVYIHSTSYAQQTFAIRGRVLDAATGNPLPAVTVSIDQISKTVTDDQGHFVLQNIPAGVYSIHFSSSGYTGKSLTIRLPGDTALLIDVRLVVNVNSLKNVTVTGVTGEDAEARAVKRSVMPVTILSGKDLVNRAANLSEILTRQTGVQIRFSGGTGSDARISVRGLEGKRVQVFINGNPLNSPDGSFGINDLPLVIIERIEVYKGAVPAWLGSDGLGSAINVVIRERDVSYIDASVTYQSYNTLNTGLIVKKTFDKAGIEAGAGIFTVSSDNDYVMQSPYQDGLKIKRDHDKFSSVLTGGSVKFHKLWFDELEIEGAYLNANKEYQGIQSNVQYAKSNGQTGVAVISARKKGLLNDRLAFRYNAITTLFTVKFIDTSSYMYDWDGNPTPSIYKKGELGRGPNLSKNVQSEFRHRANVNYELTRIFNLNLNNTLRYGKFDPKDDLGNEYAGKNLYNYPGSVFNAITGLTLETHLKDDRLLASAALKHYYNSVEGYNTNIYLQGTAEKASNTTNTIGYNMGMRYNFTSTLLAKASYERAVRLPLSSELFGDGALITPAILLKPEKAHNYSLGVYYDKRDAAQKRLQLEANAFYMKVSNMIQLSGNGLTTGYVNYAFVDIIGADAEAKIDVTNNLFVNGNITWQRLRDINKYLPGTQQVSNPTYKLQIPNVPEMFSNLTVEYHRDNWLGKNTKTRIIYEGSHSKRYSYGFNLSRSDKFFIPSYLTQNIVIEHAFHNDHYTITGEVRNFTDATIINNWNMPLPGRTFRIRFRCLLMGKTRIQHSNH